MDASKLTATQNILRNKFEKAYTNRVEHEDNVNRALNPLTATSSSITDNLESENNNFSLHDLSKTTNDTPQLRLSTKSYSNNGINSQLIETIKEKHCDPNALCDELRTQISSLLAGEMNCIHIINNILEELRDLQIIV